MKGSFLSRRFVLPAAAIGFASLFAVLFLVPSVDDSRESTPRLAPIPTTMPVRVSHKHTDVSTGMAAHSDPEAAVHAALRMTLAGAEWTPDFLVVFVTCHPKRNVRAILERAYSAARKQVGPHTRIFGGTSAANREMLTDKGRLVIDPAEGPEAEAVGVSVLAIRSSEVVFGVGLADQGAFSGEREAGRAAVHRAMSDAGKPASVLPQMALVMAPFRGERGAIAGLEDAFGRSVPTLGGCAAPEGLMGNGVSSRGVTVALLYTRLPLAWTFGAGFDVIDSHSGVVTDVDAQDERLVHTIDGRPALDVFDEWLAGDVRRLYRPGSGDPTARYLLALYQKVRSPDGQTYIVFTEAGPDDAKMKRGDLRVAKGLREGETIFATRGHWETVLNRIGNLPESARTMGALDPAAEPVFGLGFICASALSGVPVEERGKIPQLVRQGMKNQPFIFQYAWGEIGSLPGVGAQYGNLNTSFVLVGSRPGGS